jgi:hypothetical protein
MKPMLKAPGTKRLKLNYDELLTNVAFNIRLRRYTRGGDLSDRAFVRADPRDVRETLALVIDAAWGLFRTRV